MIAIVSSPPDCTSCRTKMRSKREEGWRHVDLLRDGEMRIKPTLLQLAAPRRANQTEGGCDTGLAIDTLCCSIASCSPGGLCHSFCQASTAAIPVSASTSAPASSIQRPSLNSSFTAAAVRPALWSPDCRVNAAARPHSIPKQDRFSDPRSPTRRT